MNKNIFIKFLSVVQFIAILVLIYYLGMVIKSSETLEERLQYQEPTVQQELSNNSLNNDDFENVKNIQYTYVPSYSHIYTNNGQPLLLESTLSIRNTDSQHGMVIHKVEYYDSNGNLLRSYLDKSRLIKRLASVEYLSEKTNEAGGVGAFFVVLWSSENKLAEPVIESVMIETTVHKQISFVSRGKTLPYEFKK